MRSLLSKSTFLALAMMVAGAMVASCQKSSDKRHASNVGAIGLALELAPGVTVNEVRYEITGNGITPITGSIPVSDPAARVSALVSGIPVGAGFRIDLQAVSADSRVRCAGNATFDVAASRTTAVTVDLQCEGERGTGSVLVNGRFNQCPVVTSFSAAPLAVAVGGTINLAAMAVDSDSTALTYAWTASAGSFANASAGTTTYSCSAGGPQTLTLTVGDGGCEDTATVTVDCIAVLCGNGRVDANETCDDGNTAGGDACPADCTLAVCGDGNIEGPGETCDDGNTAGGDNCPADCTLAVCGDGAVEGPSEECEPPGTATCSATCRNVTGCGNGRVETGEACDDGNTTAGDGCSATCTAEPRCGNGVVEPGEGCEPANTATCSATCQPIVAETPCRTCENNRCASFIAECENAEGNATEGPRAGTAKRELCRAAIACARTANCAKNGPEECYCGAGVSPVACISGQARGVCKAEFEAAAESTDPVNVSERFVDPGFAAGNAVRLLQCDQEFCAAQCFP